MKTLRIVGSGVSGIDHLTQESIRHITQSDKLLWLGTTAGLAEFVIENHLDGEDISYCYENGALDSDNYHRIKAKVFNDLENTNDLTVAVLGHPRLGVTIVQEFQNEAHQRNIKLIVTPGISSFDTMINDLCMDPIEEGTCLVDANRLILYNYQMDPSLNYFIYHVCSIGNSKTDYESPVERNAVSYLKEKLTLHFPVDHEIILVASCAKNGADPVMTRGTIKELVNLLENVTFDSTLFIPALLPKASSINKAFYKLITQVNK